MSNKYDRHTDDLFDFEPTDGDETLMDDDRLARVLDEIAEIKHTISEMPADYDGGAGYTDIPDRREEARYAKTTQRMQEEIRRLNNRISDMESMGYRDDTVNGAVSRLSSLVEDLARVSRDNERRLLDELNSIKNQLYKSDLNAVLNAIKSNLKSSEDFIVSINNTVEGLTSMNKQGASGADTELLRQIYELKALIGSPAPATGKRNEELSELYGLLTKIKYEIKRENATIADKYSAVETLAKRLTETTESDIAPIVDSINAVIDELGSLPLEADTADEVFDFIQTHEQFAIAASRKEAIRSYLSKVDALMRDGASDNIDELPDLIAVKNGIQSNRNEFECESIYSTILNSNITLLNEKDPAKLKALRAEIKKQIKRLTVLEVKDLIDYPYVKVTRPYRIARLPEGEGLCGKIAEIKNLLLDTPTRASAVEPQEEGIVAEISDIKNEIYGLSNMEDISQAILDLKGDCLAILDKLEEKGEGGSLGAATLEETVAQLDRLFDDIRNLASDCENSVMGAIEVLGDAIATISQVQEDNNKAAMEDRIKLLADVAFIRATLERNTVELPAPVDEPIEEKQEEIAGYAEIQPAVEEVPEDEESEEIVMPPAEDPDPVSGRLDIIERNQQAILDALEYLVLKAQDMAEGGAPVATAVAPVAPTETKETVDRTDEVLAALARIEGKLDCAIEKLNAAPAPTTAAPSEVIVAAPVSSDGEVLKEIRKLRDQLFAVSMASVSVDGEENYESYNNVILDEIYAIADAVDAISEKLDNKEEQPESDTDERVADEIAELRSMLTDAIAEKNDDAEVMKEIKKLRESLNKRPAPTPTVVTAPAPKAKSRKKTVSPVHSKEFNVSDLLHKIGETDIVRNDD